MNQYNKRITSFCIYSSPDFLLFVLIATIFICGAKLIRVSPQPLVLSPQQLADDQGWLSTREWQVPARISGFYPVEQLADGYSYRWTNGHALIKLPNSGNPMALRLRLSAGVGQSRSLSLRSDSWTALLSVTPAFRDYYVLLPSGSGLRTGLRLDSDTFKPEGEGRRLGVLVGNLRLVRESIPLAVRLLLAFSMIGIYTTLRLHQYSRSKAFIVTLLVGVTSIGAYLVLTWYTPERTLLGGILLILLGWGTTTLHRAAPSETTLKWLLITAGFALLGMISIALLPIAAAGSYSRYIADDYCYAVFAQDHGILGGLLHVYRSWSGRYSAILTAELLAQPGTISAPIFAIALLPMWAAAMLWLSSRMARLWDLRESQLVIALGFAWLWLTLASLPDMFQPFYWQNGSLSYSLPLVLLTAYGGLLAHWASVARRNFAQGQLRPWYRSRAIFLSALLGFLLSGFSESSAALIVSLMVILVAALYSLRAPAWLRRPSEAGLLGTVLGMATMALAPGNVIRQAYIAQERDRLDIFVAAATHASSILWKPFTLIQKVIVRGPDASLADIALSSATLLLLLLPMLIDWPQRLKPASLLLKWLPISLISGFLLILAGLLPGYLVLNWGVPERVLVLPYFAATATLLALGAILGGLLQPLRQIRRAFIPVILLCAATLAVLTPQIWPTRTGALQTYAEFWPGFDAAARQAALHPERGLEIEIPFSDIQGIVLPLENPKDWQNICVADYYGIDWVVGRLKSK